MQTRFQRITPFLWFDQQAEEAVGFYTSVFENSRVVSTTRYNEESAKASGQPNGSVMTVAFELDGQPFTAINGGPIFKFTEAVSLVVHCRSQDEVDRYWEDLTDGGDPKSQQCGWLKDRFGLSWQVVPDMMLELLSDRDPAKASRVMKAIMSMKKLDSRKLQEAADARG